MYFSKNQFYQYLKDLSSSVYLQLTQSHLKVICGDNYLAIRGRVSTLRFQYLMFSLEVFTQLFFFPFLFSTFSSMARRFSDG